MIKRFKKYRQDRPFYRTNERIFAQTVRVLDEESKQIGVLNRFEALDKARKLGLDLVEVAPNAQPPVVKIINYKKFLYQLEKKKREEKKKTKVSETKELRLGPFMDDHDLQVVIKRAKEFLKNNNKVKFVVKFVGRQIVHPEFGQETLNKALQALSDTARVEREPRFEGKQLIVLLSPARKKIVVESEVKENENQKISQEKV